MEKTITFEQFKSDWAAFFEIEEHDLNEIMVLFTQSMKESRGKLKAAIENRDFISLAKVAHSLKGLAGPDLDHVRELARDLEIAAKAEKAPESASFIEKITRALDDLIAIFPA